MLSLVYLEAGQLRQAHYLALEGLALVEQSGGCTWHTGYFYYTLFEVYYARNQLEDAAESLYHLLRIAQDWHHVDLLSSGEAARVQISLARRDLTTAQQALSQLETLVKQKGFAYHIARLESVQVHYWLTLDDLAKAGALASQIACSQEKENWIPAVQKQEVLLRVQVFLAQQQYTRAIQELEQFREQWDRLGDSDITIQFLVLCMVAFTLAGHREEAWRATARLFTLTEPEGSIRVYLDAGEPMKRTLLTLEALLAQAGEQEEQSGQVYRAPDLSHAFVLKLLTAFEQEEQPESLSAGGALQTRPRSTKIKPLPAASALPMDFLTHREQEVLRLLSQGASNQEIAEVLVIQVSTVKKHVSNILWKLGADNRTQAIARARDRSLL